MKNVTNLLEKCTLCPRNCKVNRLRNEPGFCRVGRNPKISAYNLHFGEEPPISGTRGSGTIFFTGCNMQCVFCQNYPISQLHHGKEITVEKLAEIMLELQNQGAHNINLVTPTHVVPQIIESLTIAKTKGLRVPIVYNSGGYEKVETLKLLDGYIDIYMPDAKYSDEKNAKKYSDAKDYWKINKLALNGMHRQVGDLRVKNGVAVKGLLIRHLVLPGNISGSRAVFKFVADKISQKTYMSVMAQYHPANRTDEFHELQRKLTEDEYLQVLDIVDDLGLSNGWRQML